MSDKVSSRPCPICRQMMVVIGKTNKNESLTSCGHSYSFKKTKSQKDMERKYIVTEWGLELVK